MFPIFVTVQVLEFIWGLPSIQKGTRQQPNPKPNKQIQLPINQVARPLLYLSLVWMLARQIGHTHLTSVSRTDSFTGVCCRNIRWHFEFRILPSFLKYFTISIWKLSSNLSKERFNYLIILIFSSSCIYTNIMLWV